MTEARKIKTYVATNFHFFMKVVKIVWFIAVVVSGAIYLSDRQDSLSAMYESTSWGNIVLSVLFLLVGKICVAANMKISLRAAGHSISFVKSYWIYILSDMAKYIPGFVWAYAGRVALYLLEGLQKNQIAIALFLENFWLLVWSGICGALLLFAVPDFVNQFIGNDNFAASIAILLPVVGAMMTLIISKLLLNSLSAKQLVEVVLLQIAIAFFLGVSFASLVPAEISPGNTALIAAFTVGRVIGYLAIFAPAGIGVREVVISSILASSMEFEYLLIIAGMHRALTIMAELAILPLVAFGGRNFYSDSQKL